MADLQRELGSAESTETRQSILDQVQDSRKRQADQIAGLREQLKGYTLTLHTSTQAGIDNLRILKDIAGA